MNFLSGRESCSGTGITDEKGALLALARLYAITASTVIPFCDDGSDKVGDHSKNTKRIKFSFSLQRRTSNL